MSWRPDIDMTDADLLQRLRDLEDDQVDSALARGRIEQMVSDLTADIKDGFRDVKDAFKGLDTRIDELVEESHEDSKLRALTDLKIEDRFRRIEERALGGSRRRQRLIKWAMGIAASLIVSAFGLGLAAWLK